uniref:Uncharacterized protein n=1 Tax=Ananas comosus var. bracteatus TaxID=296719 RepID=A0A6V7Q5X6_ANACO|nr:unnamed protein product [Ananas comosus var. bracteatus]
MRAIGRNTVYDPQEYLKKFRTQIRHSNLAICKSSVCYSTDTQFKFECLISVLSFFGFSGGSFTVFRPITRVSRSEDEYLAPKLLNCRFWDALELGFVRQSTGTESPEYRY